MELGDTLFIVLRKRPLIFLHYYHHVAVLIYTVHSGLPTIPLSLQVPNTRLRDDSL